MRAVYKNKIVYSFEVRESKKFRTHEQAATAIRMLKASDPDLNVFSVKTNIVAIEIMGFQMWAIRGMPHKTRKEPDVYLTDYGYDVLTGAQG
jgi:hypothetical protein